MVALAYLNPQFPLCLCPQSETVELDETSFEQGTLYEIEVETVRAFCLLCTVACVQDQPMHSAAGTSTAWA